MLPPRWRERIARWSDRYARWTTPRADGLPSLRVLLAFPALLLVAGILLVGFSINGSSSGAFHSEVSAGRDPDLLAGSPQLIRTDEWNVQTVWAIAQAEQGLPVTNESFPGGMDATIPQDLPRADWSVAFRPHLLGFLAFDVDHAIALKWWLPGLALMAAAYAFAVTMLPRRPILAAALSAGFFLSPFFQWWFLQTTLWPVAWGFTALAAIVWCLRSATRVAPIVWCAVLAYLTVVMAMGIYVPFIVPVVLTVALVGVGAVVDALRSGAGAGRVWRTVGWIGLAGVVGGAITVGWLVEKSPTVEAFLSTAYPGERLYPTGQENASALAASLSSSFALALKAGGWLGTNASEASTFFFAGALLIPLVAWFAVRSRRPGTWWMMVGASAAVLLVLAFMFVPGWDVIAHLLFLDRTIPNRLRIGVGVASFVLMVLFMRELSPERRPRRWLPIAIALAFLASQAAIAVAVHLENPAALASARWWWLLAALSAGILYLVARAHAAWGAAGLLVLGLVSAATVNPVYVGVFDLRETDASAAIRELDDAAGGATWVGVGDRMTTAILLESGVEAFNGFQGAPSPYMWGMVDPAGAYEYQWNRLAGVGWEPGTGEPTVSNPAPDQILVTFDACSAFAQEHVDYVVVDETRELPDECVVELEDFRLAGENELRIYEVVPR